MLGALLLTFLVAFAAGQGNFDAQLDSHWESFKVTYNKSYTHQNESHRRGIWEMNVALIQQHNLEADVGNHTFWLGENWLTDMTFEEYERYLQKAFSWTDTAEPGNAPYFVASSHLQLPDEVDWRKEGYVTPVKDQGICGACWAFSATGSLEGQHFKATGELVSLSEQNLIDCSQRQGNNGCGGGVVTQAFEYIMENGGIETGESYPYIAREGECKFRPENIGATCTGYGVVRGNELALRKVVAFVGPISVEIDAGHPSFQFYHSGVYNEPNCSSDSLNHAALVVGYGKLYGEDYWLVKNSWGTSWGDEGYIMMSRNRKNQCGIATYASFPLVPPSSRTASSSASSASSLLLAIKSYISSWNMPWCDEGYILMFKNKKYQ